MNNELIKRIISSIVILPIVVFFILKGSLIFNIFLLLCFFITSYEWYKMKKKILFNIFGLVFIILSFYSVYKLRNDLEGDYVYFLLVTIICVSTDIGGFIFGRFFKGPKLTQISPNKTYSGVIGGFTLSIIFSILFLKSIYSNEFLIFNKEICIFIISVSTISQIGDIIISYFKRLSNIKDTGKIIPGHGGLLDRIDGMIFAFPFAYIIILMNIF